ncbi:hypothetical protein [Leisingera sp.]|uniref:hypothetical protein n=1 Tax=Leisingera sp. TaxID=1879318 RepID=UPI002B27C0DB|nr:hypothetical protein [Leisingera sp.]
MTAGSDFTGSWGELVDEPSIPPLKHKKGLNAERTSGFTGMAKALDEQRRAGAKFENLDSVERLNLLVDREAAEREARHGRIH